MDNGATPQIIGERRKLENEKFSFEGLKRDLEKKKAVVLGEIARVKKEISRHESEIEELQASSRSLEHRILTVDDEIARMKRKINLLT